MALLIDAIEGLGAIEGDEKDVRGGEGDEGVGLVRWLDFESGHCEHDWMALKVQVEGLSVEENTKSCCYVD